MSLHNLAPVQGFLHSAYIIVGLIAGLGWWAAGRLPDGGLRRTFEVILPGRLTTLFFLPVAGFYVYMEVVGTPTVGWLRSQDQEAFETLLAGGFAVFMWMRWRTAARAGSPSPLLAPSTRRKKSKYSAPTRYVSAQHSPVRPPRGTKFQAARPRSLQGAAVPRRRPRFRSDVKDCVQSTSFRAVSAWNSSR
jgi:hypothetical protein